MLNLRKLKFFQPTNDWFYSSPHPFFRVFYIFVKGDMLVLLPFGIAILLTGLVSLRYMIILLGLYTVVRFMGEIVYWLLQQFGAKTYRPYDYGLKHLDNNAIYILYQLGATVMATAGAGIVVWALVFWP